MPVTEAMQSHVRDRLQKVAKHFDGIQSVRVTLSTEAGRHSAEMVATAKRGQLVCKVADADDMYVAIDAATDKLARQVARLKERRRDHRHERKASKTLAEEPSEAVDSAVLDEEADEYEEDADGLLE